jgi:microcystin-dependent protein
MPQSYTPPGSGTPVTVPEFDDFANGVVAFKQFADSLTSIGATVPVGTVVPFIGVAAPAGWHLCNGAEVDAVTNPVLATLCSGDRFGSAAVGKVKLPDLRSRFVLGASPTYSAASTGGAATVTLTEGHLPAHKHTVNLTSSAAGNVHTHSVGVSGTTDNNVTSHSHSIGILNEIDHNHRVPFRTANNFDRSGTGAGLVPETQNSAMTFSNAGGGHSHWGANGSEDTKHGHTYSWNGATGNANVTHTHTVTGDTANTGSGTPVSNMPPFMALNYIIKAG